VEHQPRITSVHNQAGELIADLFDDRGREHQLATDKFDDGDD
jgi:hypothetical protein